MYGEIQFHLCNWIIFLDATASSSTYPCYPAIKSYLVLKSYLAIISYPAIQNYLVKSYAAIKSLLAINSERSDNL